MVTSKLPQHIRSAVVVFEEAERRCNAQLRLVQDRQIVIVKTKYKIAKAEKKRERKQLKRDLKDDEQIYENLKKEYDELADLLNQKKDDLNKYVDKLSKNQLYLISQVDEAFTVRWIKRNCSSHDIKFSLGRSSKPALEPLFDILLRQIGISTPKSYVAYELKDKMVRILRVEEARGYGYPHSYYGGDSVPSSASSEYDEIKLLEEEEEEEA